MPEWLTFQWVFISWILSLLIHYNSLKRSTVSTAKDDLVDLLSEFSELDWIDRDANKIYQEERYNTKLSRISWKLKQLNRLAAFNLSEESKLDPLYGFDVEAFLDSEETSQHEQLKHKLQECCDDIIDTVEKNHFNKVTSSKLYIFWATRYTSIGVFLWLGILYFYTEILAFIYQ